MKSGGCWALCFRAVAKNKSMADPRFPPEARGPMVIIKFSHRPFSNPRGVHERRGDLSTSLRARP